MPTLNWIGKDKVVNHHKEVPFRILEPQYTFAHGEVTTGGGSDNKIIHGDNLEALKALLPEYEGKVNCIYIDPPYNTGNEKWVYNDNVNHPKIKKWLGEVVGKEGEDLSRHDKWLCMMYPRLKLLHKLLANDGVILVAIDDNEQAHLKLLMDEIFGAANFVTSVVWQKSKKGDAKLVSVTHEYMICYCKDKSEMLRQRKWRRKKLGADEVLTHYNGLREKLNKDHAAINIEMAKWYRSLPNGAAEKAHKHYRLSDDRGLYFPDNFAGPDDGRDSRPRYDILHPVTQKPCKLPSTGWRWEEEKTIGALAENPPRIHFGVDETTIPCRKSYLYEVMYEPLTSVFYKDGRAGTKLLDKILHKKAFDFPKDPTVLEEWIEASCDSNAIVLDSFAGSGTTAHAVLNLNKKDKGNRKFILIEMEDYADTKTAERVRKVVKGFGNAKNKVDGTGGDFSYYSLGEPLFNADNELNENVPLERIREYIYYTETGEFLKHASVSDCHYLNTHNGISYYFYYSKDEMTTLDLDFLGTITTKADQYVIYADNCLLSPGFMAKHSIIFKKIPRDITRF